MSMLAQIAIRLSLVFAAITAGTSTQREFVAQSSEIARTPMEMSAAEACLRRPNRACVLNWASAAARTEKNPLQQYITLRAIADAQAKAGLSVSSDTYSAAAEALREQALNSDVQSLVGIASWQLEIGFRNDALANLDRAHREKDSVRTYQRILFLRQLAETEAQAGLSEQAASSFDDAMKAAQSESDPVKRARDAQNVAEALLKASFNGTDIALRTALQAATDIKDAKTRAESLASLASLQARLGSPAAAIETFQQATQASVQIERQTDRYRTFQTIASKQAQSGMNASAAVTLGQALETAREIPDPGVRFVFLLELMREHARLGLRSEAGALLDEAAATAPTVGSGQVFMALAAAKAQAGFYDEALAAFRRAPSEPTEAEGRFLMVSPLEPLGRKALAKDAYSHKRLSVLCNILTDWLAAGSNPSLAEEMSTALAIARSIDEPLLRASAFRSVASLRMAAGADGAAGLLQEALSALAIADDIARSRTDLPGRISAISAVHGSLLSIAKLQAKSGAGDEAEGTWDKALQIARSVDEKSPARDEMISAIAGAEARRGQAVMALQTIRLLVSPTQRGRALLVVAEHLPG